MQLSYEEFESIINRKLKTNQLLLLASIAIAVIIFIWDRNWVWWSLYFLVIGALSLPNINKCKEDKKLFKENQFKSVQGKVLDVFPEKEGGKNWIIFLQEENKHKILEFVVNTQPNVSIDQHIVITYTPRMNIPVQIKLAS